MNYLFYLLLAGGIYLLVRRGLATPKYEKYVLVDLPPITLPGFVGSKESVYDKLIPEVRPVYTSIPPKMKLVWRPIAVGFWSIAPPPKTYDLPIGYGRTAVDSVVKTTKLSLLKTRVYKNTKGQWVVDFPEIKVPV